MGLAETLKNDAIAAVKRQLFAGLEAEIKTYEADRDNLRRRLAEKEAQLESKKHALEVVKGALGEPTSPKPSLFYVNSRTNRSGGHFISYDGATVKCSCPGFAYNGKCWASTFIKNARPQVRYAYKYEYGTTSFNQRHRPLNATFYIPGNANTLSA